MIRGIVLTGTIVLISPAWLVNAFYIDPTAGQHKRPKAPSTITKPSPQVAAPEESKSPFTPWPQPLVVSRGDYRDEAFLEQHISGPLYSKQQELPQLPLPSLEDTVERFLPTALPLAESESEQQSLLEACRRFPEEAKFLQDRLDQYRKDECPNNTSWLQHMWQTKGYLQVRNSLIEVSYFLFVPDDKTLAQTTNKGIARAAAMLNAMAESRKEICSGKMPYEKNEEEPLCSTAFKYLFHSTRIPKPSQDTYHLFDPSLHRHCVVACRGQFFAVDFVDDLGDPLPLAVMEQRLQRCVDLASSAGNNANHPQLGWLTSADRDFWTDARQELLEAGGTPMEEALKKLESGAFVLCLDEDEPETMTEAANVFWRGGDLSGGNRWCDKSLQLVCTKNGRVGYVGEHSMLDAAPVIPLIRRIIRTTHKRLSKKQQQQDDTLSLPVDGVSNIFEECWSSPTVTATATNLTSIAKAHHEKLVSDYECQVLDFTGFGKKFIKNAGFVCHDLVQQAMQLAAYRLFGKQVGTYEAALARTFLHGRTETARPVSPQSKAFIESMGLEPHHASREEKLFLLKQAASVHDEYQRVACKGLGVDRHFFGLSGMLRNGDTEPSLLSHPLYLRSKYWQLSTSSVIFAPGFGPSTDDGVAVGYRVEANSIIFTCTSRTENNAIEPFCKLLEESLTEIGDLVKNTDEELD